MLNNTDKVLGDIEDALRSMDTSAADEALKADLHRKIKAAIAALEDQLAAAEDEAVKAQLETAIADLEALDALVDTLEPSALQGPVLDMLHQVRQELLAAAVQTNKEVNEYLHTTGAQAQTTLRSVQQLLGAVGGSLGEVSGTLDSYADAMTTVQPTLDAGITLANTVETYLADIEDDVRRVTESEAFKRFTELMESSDAESMADYLSSPVQLNTEIIYEIKDYGAAMSPYYVMLALFVGSLLTAVMLKVPVTQPEFAGCPGRGAVFRAVRHLLPDGHGPGAGDGLWVPVLRGDGDGGAGAVRAGLLPVLAELCQHELRAGVRSGQRGYGAVSRYHGHSGGRVRRFVPGTCAAAAVPDTVSLHALPLRHGYDPGDGGRYVRRHIPALRAGAAGHVRAVHGVRPAGILPGPKTERGYRCQQGKVWYHVNRECPPQAHGPAGGTYAVEAMKKSYAPLLFAV